MEIFDLTFYFASIFGLRNENRNRSEKMVAFKVKTTHPKRYIVRPNLDVIPVGLKSSVKIMLQQKDAKQLRQEKISGIKALDTEYSDNKFLVQCTVVNPTFLEEITSHHAAGQTEQLGKALKNMWDKTTKDNFVNLRLKCVFSYPDDMGALLEANNIESASIPFALEVPGGAAKEGPSVNIGGGAGSHDGGDDIAELRKRYNELVNFTVQLTAERDRCKQALKTFTKNAALEKKGQTARISNVREMDEQEQNVNSSSNISSDNSTSQASAFSLWHIMLVAVLAFLMGRMLI